MHLWQSPAWPHFTFDAHALLPVVARARLAQGRMLAQAASLKLVDLNELQLAAWAQEALATANIEGETLLLQSVRASAARRLGLVEAGGAKTPDRRRRNFKADAKDARVEATLDVLQAAVSDRDRKVTSDHLFGWHAALFPTGRSGVTRIVTGAYRTHAEPMQIVTPRIGKPDIVHFEAPASADVPQLMKALLRWFNASRGADTDGLVRAALVHLWFETVHPFEDGNGRIGRALSELALAQDMQSSQRLFSLSHQLWQDRKDYYAQLQAATGQGSVDVTAWVRWFVQHVEKACDAAVAQMEAAVGKSRFRGEINAKHPDLSASQRKVLGKLFDAGPDGFEGGMSTEKYVALTGVSRATAYREVRRMLELSLLEQRGTGRATKYSLQASTSPR